MIPAGRWDAGGMAVEDPRRHGVRRRETAPDGRRYLLQAARSGYVEWPTYGAQGIVGLVVHITGTWLAWLVHRGGWTVVVWQGDEIAPKRTVVLKRRFRSQAEAVAVMDELATRIARSGLPSS